MHRVTSGRVVKHAGMPREVYVHSRMDRAKHCSYASPRLGGSPTPPTNLQRCAAGHPIDTLSVPSPVLRFLLLEPLASAPHVLPMSTFVRIRCPPAQRRVARGIASVGDARAWLSPRRSWLRCAAMVTH